MTGPAVEVSDFDAVFSDEAAKPRRSTIRARSARLFATCAQGAWLFLAATPVIVVVCALKG